MPINKLTVKNFVGIEEITVEPKKFTFISGKNGKGKTSVIEAIKAAFHGASSDKIRMGAKKSEIYLDTDKIAIMRSITSSGTNVQVTKAGKPIPKPQTYLNGIVGDFSFEPVSFFLLKPKEQTPYLLQAIPCKVTMKQVNKWLGPVDSPELNLDIHGLEVVGTLTKTLYDDRREVTRKSSELEKAGLELKHRIPEEYHDMPPVDSKKVADLTSRISDIKAQGVECESMSREICDIDKDVHDSETQIKDLQARIQFKKKRRSELETAMLKTDIPDQAPLQKELDLLQTAQSHQRDLGRLEDIRKEFKATKGKADELDKAVKNLQAAPAELMEAANMPIEGLAYTEGQFYLNGVPLTGLSTSERARFAVAVTRELNEEYPVKAICLDGFEVLDTETQKAFIKTADKDGFQYFITQVNDEKLTVTAK